MPFRAIHGAKREFMTKSIHDALHQFIQSVALLRLRGFLHAFHLVEMTTGTNDLPRRFHATL